MPLIIRIWGLVLLFALFLTCPQCKETERPAMPPELRAEGYQYAGLSCPGAYHPWRIWLQQIECKISDPINAGDKPDSVWPTLKFQKRNGQSKLTTDFDLGPGSSAPPLREVSGAEKELLHEAVFLSDHGRQPPGTIKSMLPSGFDSRHASTGFDISGDGEPDWLILGEYSTPSGSRDYRQLIYGSNGFSFELVFALPIAPIQDNLGVLSVRDWSPQSGCGGVRIEYISEVRASNSQDQLFQYDIQFIMHCKSR